MNTNLQEFYITSTISIMAKDREEVIQIIEREKKAHMNRGPIMLPEVTFDLLNNAEIDEASARGN